jgi:hypothetical protein
VSSGEQSDRGIVRDAVRVELSQDGLDLAADLLAGKALKDVDAMPIPDGETDVGGGVTAEINGARAWAKFGDLSIVARDGGLRATAKVREVRVEVPTLKLRKRVLGIPVRTTCEDTTFRIGEADEVTVTVDLALAVEGEHLTAAAGDVSAPIASDNYEVSGPDECSGGWGIGDVTRVMVHGAFVLARPYLQDLLAARVRAIAPALGAQLDEQLHPAMTMEVPALPSLPAQTAELSAFPSSLASTGGGAGSLVVTMGTRIQRVDPTKRRPGGRGTTLEGLARYGALGLNPHLITDAFAELYPGGTEWIPLDEDVAPSLEDILTVQSAAAIWPDLQELATTSRSLRVALRVAEAPRLTTDEATQTMVVALPKLTMRFQAQVGGRWIDYFDMDLAVDTGVTARMQGDSLRLDLAPSPRVRATGRWCEGYTPTIDLFESDVAEALFGTALDYLQAAGPLLTTWVPTFQVGDRSLAFASPHVKGRFIGMDLVAAP